MTTRDLLDNQVTYLTYVLWQPCGGIESEILRPTYLCLQQVRDNELSEAASRAVHQVMNRLEVWLKERIPVGRFAAEGILFTLRQVMDMTRAGALPEPAW